MEIRWMNAFVAVARELNYRRASRALHIAQPAVSMQISKLEKALGVRLFDRTSRSVRLTAAGQAFLPACQAALDAIDAAARAAQNAGTGETGRVRLGFSGAFATEGISRLAREVRRRHPGIELRIANSSNTATLLDELLNDDVDMAVISAVETRHPSIDYRLIGSQRLGALVPLDHPLAERTRTTLAAMREEPFILTDQASGLTLRDVTIAACVEAGFQPRVVQEAGDSFTVFALVSAGMGVTLVPEGVPEVWPHGVRYLELDDVRLRLRSMLVSARGRGFGALDRVLAIAEEVFPTRQD